MESWVIYLLSGCKVKTATWGSTSRRRYVCVDKSKLKGFNKVLQKSSRPRSFLRSTQLFYEDHRLIRIQILGQRKHELFEKAKTHNGYKIKCGHTTSVCLTSSRTEPGWTYRTSDVTRLHQKHLFISGGNWMWIFTRFLWYLFGLARLWLWVGVFPISRLVVAAYYWRSDWWSPFVIVLRPLCGAANGQICV